MVRLNLTYLSLTFLWLIACTPLEKSTHTNVVFLLVDDLGWTDLGCYGSSFYETPNIDKLAEEGVLFTNAYSVSPVCSPTRASILTGKHPARLNITDWIPGYDPKDRMLLGTEDQHQLPLQEKTIAETFKENGYSTGFFGKWHLGKEGYFPQDQGFDLNIGGHWAGQPASYFYPYKNNRKRWDVPNLEGGKEGEYLTDRLTDESLKFLETHKGQPFFLYLAYYTVHTPIQAKSELESKYQRKLEKIPEHDGPDYRSEKDVRSKLKQDDPSYAGMVQSLDENVGRIMKKLRELNLIDNTIIVFTSDNGGLSTLSSQREPPTSTLPLRAGKGWLYEGGIRVPLIVRWSGSFDKGKVSSIPVMSTDHYPTLLQMTGISTISLQHLDGRSFLPALKNETILNDTLVWHFPHYHGSGNRPSSAVRLGKFKLIEWYEDDSYELFDLEKDIEELVNLTDSLPEVTDNLKTILSNWKKEMKAEIPRPNPNYAQN